MSNQQWGIWGGRRKCVNARKKISETRARRRLTLLDLVLRDGNTRGYGAPRAPPARPALVESHAYPNLPSENDTQQKKQKTSLRSGHRGQKPEARSARTDEGTAETHPISTSDIISLPFTLDHPRRPPAWQYQSNGYVQWWSEREARSQRGQDPWLKRCNSRQVQAAHPRRSTLYPRHRPPGATWCTWRHLRNSGQCETRMVDRPLDPLIH